MNPVVPHSPSGSEALSVTALTELLGSTLEEGYGSVWVVGELSSVSCPASGHIYFVLKDDNNQLRGVMFRGYARTLRFKPEDGLQVLIRGRVGLYSARGALQIYAAGMETRGVGDQQLALEQLKVKLAAEGLFAKEKKRRLPFFPRSIGVVTALEGAALQDIIAVLHERCPYTRVIIRPTKVQGVGAGAEIAAAVEDLNEDNRPEVLIIGRGGGSREDLQAFDEEVVARAIARSTIPTISAVGHEIDVSLADLVADRRAPTPTAAAEIVVPIWSDLSRLIEQRRDAFFVAMQRAITIRRNQVKQVGARVRLPGREIAHMRQRVASAFGRCISHLGQRVGEARAQLQDTTTTLNSLNPLAVLQRGYGLVRTVPHNHVVRDAAALRPGEEIRITFASGEARARVEGTTK